MIDIGSLEFFLLLVVALLVVGPQRLPEVAREVGRGIGKVKRMLNRFREESQIDKHIEEFRSYVDLEDDMQDFQESIQPLKQTTDEIKEVSSDIKNNLNNPISTISTSDSVGRNTQKTKAKKHQTSTSQSAS